jgi:hypothetical protein
LACLAGNTSKIETIAFHLRFFIAAEESSGVKGEVIQLCEFLGIPFGGNPKFQEVSPNPLDAEPSEHPKAQEASERRQGQSADDGRQGMATQSVGLHE